MSSHRLGNASSLNSDDNDRWNDIVERVVTAVEARQDTRAAQIDAAAGGARVQHAAHEDTLGGPLTSIEISRLQQVEAWNTVDADLLLNLCTFLEPHVNSAASVNLIREVHRWMGTGGEKKRRTSVDEVRVLFSICVFTPCFILGEDLPDMSKPFVICDP